jgi:hypothetical protein
MVALGMVAMFRGMVTARPRHDSNAGIVKSPLITGFRPITLKPAAGAAAS